jgi:DNA-binding NarL/FixJ family response regulator
VSNQKPNSIRLVLIDDEPIVREGLKLLLETWGDIEVVGEASNQDEARSVLRATQPDVVLLKLYLGRESSFSLISELVSVAPRARLLALTGISDAEQQRQAVRAGLMGVVLREQSPAVLVKAIHRVHAGEAWLDPAMVARLIGEMAHPHPLRASDPEAIKIETLTPREREVLAPVCRGLHNKEIAGLLGITEATVRHHLSSMYKKLSLSGRLELVIYSNHHNILSSAADEDGSC